MRWVLRVFVPSTLRITLPHRVLSRPSVCPSHVPRNGVPATSAPRPALILHAARPQRALGHPQVSLSHVPRWRSLALPRTRLARSRQADYEAASSASCGAFLQLLEFRISNTRREQRLVHGRVRGHDPDTKVIYGPGLLVYRQLTGREPDAHPWPSTGPRQHAPACITEGVLVVLYLVSGFTVSIWYSNTPQT